MSNVQLQVQNHQYQWNEVCTFCTKKGIESCQLPPCSDCLSKHCLGANCQGAIWRKCLENNSEVPSPVEHGWSRADQDGDLQLSIDWFSVSIGPQVVLEFLSCSCKRDCVTPSCQCVANNLACTDPCYARQCKNQKMIPLMRIQTRSLINVVALNDAMCAKNNIKYHWSCLKVMTLYLYLILFLDFQLCQCSA